MKKYFLPLGISLAVATASASTLAPSLSTALKSLNSEIKRVLTPYQDKATKATLVFKRIDTDSDRVLGVKVAGVYRKSGSLNKVELKIDDLSYDYGDGTAPTTKAKGSIGIDVTKIFPQETLNKLIPGVEEMAKGLASEFTQEYGDAAIVTVTITDKQQDAAGNFTSIKAELSGKIDLAKLPNSKKSEDVLFTDASATISVDLKTGATFALTVVSNPQYKGFRKDETGLKETLEKLLARDAGVMGEIKDTFAAVDKFAAGIVNKK